MTRYLTLGEVVELHRLILGATGGAAGIRDLGALESAIAQPNATFGGTDLYPTLIEKAAALCFALARGHPFVDGNKRIGFAVAVLFLELNGYRFEAGEADATVRTLALAAGDLQEKDYAAWLKANSRRARPTRSSRVE